MNQFIIVITGVHILAHSIFGCCAQHAIASEKQSGCCHSSYHLDNSAHQKHRLDPEADLARQNLPYELIEHEHDDSGESPSPTHKCSHKGCQWMIAKSNANTSLLHDDVAPLANSTLAAVAASVTGPLLLETVGSCFRHVALLRTHLQFSVLLI